MSASENQVVEIKQEVVEDQTEAMRLRAVMKNRLLWNIIVCQFEICDPYNNQRSGKMPMSTGLTILTGSDAPMMTAQVNIYLCEGYTEKLSLVLR